MTHYDDNDDWRTVSVTPLTPGVIATVRYSLDETGTHPWPAVALLHQTHGRKEQTALGVLNTSGEVEPCYSGRSDDLPYGLELVRLDYGPHMKRRVPQYYSSPGLTPARAVPELHCSTTGVTDMIHNDDTPTLCVKTPWPASVYPRGGGLSRRCRTARRPRRLAEPPRSPMHWQAQRLDIATRSDTRPDGETSPTTLPQMPGAARLSGVARLAAQVKASVRHYHRWANPPGTARRMTVPYMRLARPHSHEHAVPGAVHQGRRS